MKSSNKEKGITRKAIDDIHQILFVLRLIIIKLANRAADIIGLADPFV